MIELKASTKVHRRDHGTALEDEILSSLRIDVTRGNELVEMEIRDSVHHVAAEGRAMWKKSLMVALVSGTVTLGVAATANASPAAESGHNPAALATMRRVDLPC